MTTNRKEVPPEAATFLAAHPDVRAVELLLPDLNAILRGKRVSRRELAGFYRDGISFPATGILLDSRGSLIDGLVHGSDDGDPDYVCLPVPGSLAPVPWSKAPLGQCLISMYERDGRPYFADARHVLARVLARFADLGLTPVVAVEYEFYLLDDVSGEVPRTRTGRVPGSSRRPAGPRAYSLEDLHDLDDFFTHVSAAAEIQGVPAGAIVSEYGAGQFEVNLHHENDALAACDHAIVLRRLIRGSARQQGLAATFMAKPFRDLDGSGMHVHFSLLDRDGRNVFAPHPPALTPDAYPDTLRHAVGGMLAAIPESLAVFAPNANSYRRFRPGFFVPIAPNWGPNHRQVALRIPTSDEANVRLEHRVAGADCNPYLAMAAILAAAHAGITGRAQPPAMVREGEAVSPPTGASPRWETALAAFDASELWPDYFGAEFCRVYSAARRFEAEAYHAEVPGLDYEWYLGAV
ncbi:MAG: glutamine synthetase family protein [Gammaproteobacteria bacterium]